MYVAVGDVLDIVAVKKKPKSSKAKPAESQQECKPDGATVSKKGATSLFRRSEPFTTHLSHRVVDKELYELAA